MDETGSTCRTAVVGSDGSESSLRAVAGIRRSRCDVLVVHTTG